MWSDSIFNRRVCVTFQEMELVNPPHQMRITSHNVYRSLPNWTDLQAQKMTHHRRRPLRREETTEEESPEDIRQRNMREAEILASNLGEGGISAHEILSDVGQLKRLAQLQESMASLATLVYLHHAEQCSLPSGPYACC